jgi:hypothetical protein
LGWEREALEILDRTEEVEIETTRPDGQRQRTIIWVVVQAEDVFVRSVRGDRGRWWQAAVDRPDEVALVFDGRRLEVRAESAIDGASIERCSRALEGKYTGDPSTPSMTRPEVLGTTLRLLPRQ